MTQEGKIIKSGKWSAEFDEDGNVTKATGSDSYRRLLGCEGKDENADLQQSWEGQLHPEDAARVKAHLAAVLARHPEGMDYDIEYRILTKWGYHWVHAYAGFVRRADGSPLRCDGVTFDLQDTIDRQAREALQENASRILLLEDNFAILFDVDLETGEYDEYTKGQSYSKDIRTQLVEYKEFFSDTLKNVDRIVYPEDREAFNRVINREHIREALEKSNRLDCYYRQIIGGNPVWFRMRIVYKDAAKRRIIIGIFNAEEEMAEQQKNERLQTELMNRMSDDDGLLLVNFAEDKKKVIYDRFCKEGKFYAEEKYSEAIMWYVSTFVADIDRAKMEREVSLAHITERLQTEDEYEVEYRDVSSGVHQFFVMKVARFSDSEFLLSFSNKDREIIDRLLFSKLGEEFYSLFGVDLDTGLVQVLKTSARYYSREEGEIVSYTRAIKAMAAGFEGETRAFFEKISNISYLKQRFADEDKITYSFKAQMPEGLRWVSVLELVLDRHEDGSPSRFALGFSLLDAEASEKAELQEALQRAEVTNWANTSLLLNISRDIRTPLNAVLDFTEKAQKHPEDRERVADCLSRIEDAGQQLLQLISQVPEISRFEPKKKPDNAPETVRENMYRW